ncbi:MAG: PIG-L family deacetylase [Defluviimonas sp.]|uniref:PIG-L deacetylase family protein n=1 Tax=Albidovulum sp. TaxID=1872424 RepID=UPI002A294462|nr:PIG-L family deacetylase [Defluviimonas sp.]
MAMHKDLLRRGLSFAYRRLAPAGTRNLISTSLLLTGRDEIPRAITDFATGPVLIVAPHFDDEICGCGGVMGLHATAGQTITVVFVTDGAAGDPSLRGATMPADELKQARARLTVLRESESRAACAEYGISDLRMLNGPDGALAPTNDLVEAMGAVLDDVRPAIVYHPSLLDAHSDHWNSNLILAGALKARPALSGALRLRGYEVWTPAIPNRFANIDAEVDRKQRAFAHFVSQNATVDYPRAIGGLNAYRSIYMQGGQGQAEAFQELSVAAFDLLISAILARPHHDHSDP